MELTRADIGFGRVILDEVGVTRRGLFRTRALAWGAIHEYRLSIELHGEDAAASFGLALAGPDDLDVVRAMRGDSQREFGIELRGDDGRRLAIGWRRFCHTDAAIAEILRRVRDRLAERARTQLKIRGRVAFGPLELAPHAVQWRTHPPLAHDAVESIELFDASLARLRVMARGKVWPYGQAPTGQVPNVVTALEIAGELGYRVRGQQLIAPLLP